MESFIIEVSGWYVKVGLVVVRTDRDLDPRQDGVEGKTEAQDTSP